MTGYRRPLTDAERAYWARRASDEEQMLRDTIEMLRSVKA